MRFSSTVVLLAALAMLAGCVSNGSRRTSSTNSPAYSYTPPPSYSYNSANTTTSASSSARASGSPAQINYGSAREMDRRAGAGQSGRVAYENCTCGPDYIACHERNCRRGGERCQISRGSGSVSIVSYDNQGRRGTTHVWYGGNKCGAQAY